MYKILGVLLVVLAVSASWATPAVAQSGTTTSSNPSWLTQPVATVITGALAVTTAVIALVGVLLNRRQTERHFTKTHELEQIKGLRERYTTCAEQLAHANPAVRQAGVYALAALADDWNKTTTTAAVSSPGPGEGVAVEIHEESRVCLDLLCAYLRSSTESEDGEVRQSIAAVIRRHALSWRSYTYDLRRADLTNVVLVDANLTGADLIGADMTSANLSGANLTEADLIGATLSRAHLVNANLVRADMDSARLDRANLKDAKLNEANLASTNLSNADLTGSDLTGARLTGTALVDANLTGAMLASADLTSADLKGADLSSAYLGNACLRHADLAGANLKAANLTGADLHRTNLNGADLSGAELHMISAGVIYNDDTVWPAGWTLPPR
ncbi:Uncharacterized protein YjbI, contains pentapeptide repeats [Nocardia amikacinitolerans]|uniref:pentapeptide repeat-containing protein n=1 Tax=Nocardia amikacinitolerans TaxID=756689 RepID=UPI0020A58716|nr:pentapeptide repeat-containing protein [Nocardia amikacinitolerans]MCP2297576.1 Uncharacterized protein YjbI, contains pentapeptide repeats [Nocardia amikacinitolerans]